MFVPDRGIFIGRFQPPHLGHLNVIKKILEERDEVIIMVAAAQLSHTFKNPLTAGERLELIRSMLDEDGIDRSSYWLIPLQDIMDNSLWVYHVLRSVPKFGHFYGNNQFTKMLFENAGIKVKMTGIIQRESLEGTKIRRQMSNGEDLNSVLSPIVIRLLEDWKIRERLIASQNENPVSDLV